MYQYAILANPGHNRVYFDASRLLSLAELEIVCMRMEMPGSNIRAEQIAEITYYVFSTEGKLSIRDISLISRLSFAYAIYELVEADGIQYLLPIAKTQYQYFDSDISSILKYSGKTNELFTRMMINVGLYSGEYHGEEDIRLLDPIAGKGTTLFEGLIAGYSVSGIEISDKAVHETQVYFKKYLETQKYKHTLKKEKLTGENRAFTSTIYKFQFCRTKEESKKEGLHKTLTMIAGNSMYANKFFKKDSFHCIVGDLPYGVAHGTVTNQKQSSQTRNPKELLATCLPAWHTVLKSGGTMVLAWNTFVLPKDELIGIVEDNGFTVLQDKPYDQFEHRVDQAIKRDIIVARK